MSSLSLKKPLLPSAPSDFVCHVSASVDAFSFQAKWTISGDISRLLIPNFPAGRFDQLWKETCFEIFLQHLKQENYFEYNFSPQSGWNCYAFKSYRQGMEIFDTATPTIESTADEKNFTLSVVAENPLRSLSLKIGISCVIKDIDQRLHYFALGHSADKPDFHDSLQFIPLDSETQL